MRRMTDDEIEDYAYQKVFDDLDDIHAGSVFSKSADAVEGAAPNAGTPGIEGISLEIKPIMAAAAESGRESEGEKSEPEDRLKGISRYSPLMSQLHGDR